MGYSKKLPITTFQRQILDEYYSNGLNSILAYCSVKGIKEPKEQRKRINISSKVSQIKITNPEYIAKLEAKNEESYGGMKKKLIEQLEDISGTFNDMLKLALKDSLTEEELNKFYRLRSIMTTKDLNKATELLGKLTGSFESEKKLVSHVFQVDFGDTPQIQEYNKDIIDITPEEEI